MNHLQQRFLMFLFGCIGAIIGNKQSWIYLLVDVSIGLISFLDPRAFQSGTLILVGFAN
jgi:hypothetical protein